jgi:hypothetical protein
MTNTQHSDADLALAPAVENDQGNYSVRALDGADFWWFLSADSIPVIATSLRKAERNAATYLRLNNSHGQETRYVTIFESRAVREVRSANATKAQPAETARLQASLDGRPCPLTSRGVEHAPGRGSTNKKDMGKSKQKKRSR